MENETMIIEQEFAKIPQNMGDYDELVQQGVTSFGVKERVNRYGCEFESIVENNTYAPMTWDGSETFTEDTTHWRRVTGSPEAWIAGRDKPAASEQYPYNGMGRITLHKNMVSGVNTLTQSMLQATNTIYVIRYDFTLSEDITVPANCVLEFDGGSISGNHIVTFNLTGLSGLIKLHNVTIAGTIKNNCIHGSWFTTSNEDKSIMLNNLSNVHKKIDFDNISYNTYNPVIISNNSSIKNIKIQNKDTDTTHSAVEIEYNSANGNSIVELDNITIQVENELTYGLDLKLIRYSKLSKIDVNGPVGTSIHITQVFVSSINGVRMAHYKNNGIRITDNYSTSFHVNDVYSLWGTGNVFKTRYLSYSILQNFYCDHHLGGGEYFSMEHTNGVTITNVGAEDSIFTSFMFCYSDDIYLKISGINAVFSLVDQSETYICKGAGNVIIENAKFVIANTLTNEYKRGFFAMDSPSRITLLGVIGNGVITDQGGNTLVNSRCYCIDNLFS